MTPTSHRVATRVAELVQQRRSFVQATVVRAQCPTSVRPGDAAVVLADGSIEGFIGGQCAEGSVRTAALGVLESGESVLLRILPEDGEEFPATPGAVTTINPCLSGGALEVFLEPMIPAFGLTVVGQTPIADALIHLGGALGYAVVSSHEGSINDEAPPAAVIIASHGRNEEASIRAALDAGVGFIGLVASQRRGTAVLEQMDLNPEERQAVRSPVGAWIGAKTAEEIALSVLADVIKAVRLEGLRPPKAHSTTRPTTAVDPVCHMAVTVQENTPHLHHNGADYWFCNPGCRTRYAEELGAA
ncbi:MAG: carbon monoxide dehydrogenase accessory protein [Acidimicrobiales bacterium]|nr:carbon monoxide dehydrogenase accessory protein [Acidimicrobiales bacterium]